MPSLVIHAPDYQTYQEDKQSFDDTFKSGKGNAYALNKTILARLQPEGTVMPGWRVALLCKNSKLRAEGELVGIKPAIKNGGPWFTKNGIRRYDVYIKNIEMVPYRPEALNRNGVAII